MRLDSINELLKEASELIDVLEKQKKEALTNKEIQKLSGAKIKSAHEQLRSIFDYISHDTYELLRDIYVKKGISVKEVKPEKISFPIWENPKDFRKNIQEKFRYIDELCPKLFDLMQTIQPFKGNKTWLWEFRNITNFNKHNDFTKQEKSFTNKITDYTGLTRISWGGGITITQSSFNGKELLSPGETIDIKDSAVTLNGNSDYLKTLKIKSRVDFRVDGNIMDVVITLKSNYKRISDFKDFYYRYLIDYSDELTQ